MTKPQLTGGDQCDILALHAEAERQGHVDLTFHYRRGRLVGTTFTHKKDWQKKNGQKKLDLPARTT